ncbi:MAG: DUF4199 domain-containing protein, partial [Bacteroidota bacterium]
MTRQAIILALLAGLIGGIIFLIFFSLLYVFLGNPFLPAKSYDFFIYLFVLIGTLFYYRFRMNKGRLRFREGLAMGMIIVSITLILSVIFTYIFIKNIAPEAVQAQARFEINQFVKAKEQLIQEWNDLNKDGELIFQQTYENFKKRDWDAHLIR